MKITTKSKTQGPPSTPNKLRTGVRAGTSKKKREMVVVT